MSNERITRLTFEVNAAARKLKLGDYLFDSVPTLSKMYLRELIRDGKCEVNGAHENSGYRLRERDFVELEADLARGTAMRPEAIPLDIVFEDAEIIVINKPTGMLVHPSHREKTGTLLNALVHHLNAKSETHASAGCDGWGGQSTLPIEVSVVDSPSSLPPAHEGGSDKIVRPGLPHRLDKQTSGLIVAAKTARAQRRLTEHFMAKRVEKLYLALVNGIVSSDEGVIEAPIGRHPELKHWSVKLDGKHSLTRFRVRERFADTTLLELEPVTGRTNQLRIHCETLGHPIVGDNRRGGREFERLCLHAYRLAFPHPTSGEAMNFVTDLPAFANAGMQAASVGSQASCPRVVE